jgi:hypothetical protein
MIEHQPHQIGRAARPGLALGAADGVAGSFPADADAVGSRFQPWGVQQGFGEAGFERRQTERLGGADRQIADPRRREAQQGQSPGGLGQQVARLGRQRPAQRHMGRGRAARDDRAIDRFQQAGGLTAPGGEPQQPRSAASSGSSPNQARNAASAHIT